MIWKLLLLLCFQRVFLLMMLSIQTEKLLLKSKQGGRAGHVIGHLRICGSSVGSYSTTSMPTTRDKF
ncbi:hypothetical protein BT93_F1584 [Corymbia citriodora subsp. variegata]|nr:hypothetical protein BT93_F1584 [Corymbia citriodora subsp. variegata]